MDETVNQVIDQMVEDKIRLNQRSGSHFVGIIIPQPKIFRKLQKGKVFAHLLWCLFHWLNDSIG